MNRLAALLLLCAAARAAFAAPQLALPGEAFHGDEVPAHDGETWLALVVADAKPRLQAVKLAVAAVNDPVLDGPGDATGRSVAAPGVDALVFLRGVAALKPGAVAVVVGEQTRLDATRPLELRLGARTLRIVSQCKDAPDGAGGVTCDVALDDGAAAQTLFSTYGMRDGGTATFGDGEPSLMFAGDLDRDGRIDLVLDTRDHYNMLRPTLFLSSAAKPGRHVAEVAKQTITGC